MPANATMQCAFVHPPSKIHAKYRTHERCNSLAKGCDKKHRHAAKVTKIRFFLSTQEYNSNIFKGI